MLPEEQARLDCFVNSCEAFVQERGKVTSIPGKNGTRCLEMKFETAMLTILIYVVIAPHPEDNFCIVFVRDAGTIVLFATGFYGRKAYGMKPNFWIPSKWESKIRSMYPN